MTRCDVQLHCILDLCPWNAVYLWWMKEGRQRIISMELRWVVSCWTAIAHQPTHTCCGLLSVGGQRMESKYFRPRRIACQILTPLLVKTRDKKCFAFCTSGVHLLCKNTDWNVRLCIIICSKISVSHFSENIAWCTNMDKKVKRSDLGGGGWMI